MNIDLKKLIIEWVKRDGRGHVMSTLMDRNLSDSMSIQLTRGYYKSEPKGATRVILIDELKNAGFLTDKGDKSGRRKNEGITG